MLQKRKKVRASNADPEFVEHCSKMVCTVCSFCGSDKIDRIDWLRNIGRCGNKHCSGSMNGCVGGDKRVPLAPSLETIYGHPEVPIRDGGTGETRQGNPSISEIMRRILARKPRNDFPAELYSRQVWEVAREMFGAIKREDV